jgi:hypothetical protein
LRGLRHRDRSTALGLAAAASAASASIVIVIAASDDHGHGKGGKEEHQRTSAELPHSESLQVRFYGPVWPAGGKIPVQRASAITPSQTKICP